MNINIQMCNSLLINFCTISLTLALPVSGPTVLSPKCLNENNERVCVTPGCMEAAVNILNAIDQSVDPCNDFYEFACGTFLKDTVVPDDIMAVTRDHEVRNKIYDQLHTMLEEPVQIDESRPYALLKAFYTACMDTKSIEREGLNSIKKMLKELGGWPVVEGSSWDETKFDWKELVYKFAKLGSDNTGFHRMWMGSKNFILFDEITPMVKKEYLDRGLNSSFIQAFYNFSLHYAIEYGADLEYAKKEMGGVTNFLIELSQILLNSVDRRNVTALNNRMTVAGLERRFPSFPWLNYINKIIEHPNITFTDAEVVNVAVPSYIPKIEELINRTPKRVQANYLQFQFLRSLAGVQPEKIKRLEFELTTVVDGVQKQLPKWKQCTIAARTRMGIATAALYVQKYFNEKSKNNVIEMISDIKAAFVNGLENLDWMDEDTQEEAIDKAEAIVENVAYPQELLNNTVLDDFYANLEPADSYFNFYLNNLKFEKQSKLERFKKPKIKKDWIRYAISTNVNAYYRASENSIELPAGILQGAYFDQNRPQYLNYGGIGFIIGHEITHGFDDKGRQIDKDGYLINWWFGDTESTFINKTKCIIEQYSNLSIPNTNLTISGVKTLGENIADNGGLKVAYLAYQSWVKRNGEESYLPCLKYTPNQIFWISVGNIWCSKERLEATKKFSIISSHSPSNMRVNEPMRNLQYFAKDFNCPIGSKMNPMKKCSVW